MTPTLLLDMVLKATALFGAAELLNLALRRLSAAARYVIWIATLAGALALPLLTLTVPAWRIPMPAATAALFRADAVAGVSQAGPEYAGYTPAGTQAPHPAIPWNTLAVWLWATGAGLVLARVAAGSWIMRRMARRGIGAPAAIEERARQLAGGVRARIVLTDATTMPMTCGILRPTVLLPAGAPCWPAERLNAVLLHELAHVRRRDTLWHSVANLASALYWPHPLAWRALKHALLWRERAADDFVLASGARPSHYAGSLIEIARSLAAPRLCRSVAMANPSQLEGRLIAILDDTASRRPPSRIYVGLTAVATLSVALVLASLHPVQAQIADQKPGTEALTAAERQYGARSVEVARVLVSMQDYARAIPIFEALAPNDQAFAAALYHTAVLTKDPQLYTRALDVARKSGNAAIVARVLHNLAVMTWKDDPVQAEANFKEAVAIESGLGSPTTAAATLEVYASYLRNAGRDTEAEDLTARASQIRGLAAKQVPPPVSSSDSYKVGKDVTPPQLLLKREPAYSEEAREAKVQGTVTLYAEIAPDGLVHTLYVTQPLGFGLDEEALRAVRQWRFQPGKKDGEPVTVRASIEVNFRLL